MNVQTNRAHPNPSSTAIPVAQSDRVHHLMMASPEKVAATVVLHDEAKAVVRDGQLRIVWGGDQMVDAIPLRGVWELTPEQAQEKGLCVVEYATKETRTNLAEVVTELDDLIVLAADNPRTKRMAERARRMLVEGLGGEAALAAMR